MQERILYQLVSRGCSQPVDREGKGGHTQRSQQSQTRRTTSDTDNIVDIGGLVWFRGKLPASGNSPGPTRPANVWTRRQSSKRTHCDCVLAGVSAGAIIGGWLDVGYCRHGRSVHRLGIPPPSIIRSRRYLLLHPPSCTTFSISDTLLHTH